MSERRLAASAEERAVMAVLMERGHYEETPDAFEWANVDAVHLVAAVNRLGRTHRVVWESLVNTGLHNPALDDEAACLGEDVRSLERVIVASAMSPSSGTRET